MSRIEKRTNILTNDYLKAFLAFSIKRCRSADDALDLTNEIIYNCLLAIKKNEEIKNFNAYLWSIAHNTYKRYLNDLKKAPIFNDDYIMNMAEITEEDDNLYHYEQIRKALSHMVGIYRNVLVMYYYDGLKIKEIALRLELSPEIVKYYLVTSRQKMKGIYKEMEKIDNKSFNPQILSLRMWGIDFNNIDIWNLTSRILPQQILIVCNEKVNSVYEISCKLNVASVFIEDEIKILVTAGLLIKVTKDKYQTNFLLIDKNTSQEIDYLFLKLYRNYMILVNEEFEKILPELKKLQIFKQEVSITRYYALFLYLIAKIDYRDEYVSDGDYPILLSNGVRAFIYSYVMGITEEQIEKYYSQTPVTITSEKTGITKQSISDSVKLWVIDLGYNTHHHENLVNNSNSQVIYDVYNGLIDEDKKELYSELIASNYLVKVDGQLYSNIAVINSVTKKFFEKINNRLVQHLADSKDIKNKIADMIKYLLPLHLKQYSKGFAKCLCETEAANNFYKYAFDNNKYLSFTDLEKQPYFCNIQVK